MLWYKNWLETRFRILFVFGAFLLSMSFVWKSIDMRPAALVPPAILLNNLTFYLSLIPVMLAGAGIKTQPILRTTKGLHGSMYFTLALPVSRFRLLAVRASLGALEMVGLFAVLCVVVRYVFPTVRAHFTPADLFAYWVTVSVCAAAFYSLSVLFATFLDDLWQIWGSAVVILTLRWVAMTISIPPALNIFQAMAANSPLFTHELPWGAMGVSLAIATILFLVAIRVVQTHEY